MNTMYSYVVPKLWTDTISEHRQAVHDATLDAAAALVVELGLASVTMSRIAAEAGIGRAAFRKLETWGWEGFSAALSRAEFTDCREAIAKLANSSTGSRERV